MNGQTQSLGRGGSIREGEHQTSMSLIIIAGSITKYKFRVLCCKAYSRKLDLRGETGGGVLVNV